MERATMRLEITDEQALERLQNLCSGENSITIKNKSIVQEQDTDYEKPDSAPEGHPGRRT